jgi:lipopolysaccharide export system permease protein
MLKWNRVWNRPEIKILDRYILKEFLFPFMYCSLTFFLIYLIADLFEHMDKFIEAKASWLNVVSYYFYLLPTIFTHTAPFSLVMALIYELGNFARHFEIIGMKASGVSPARIAQPFFFVGLSLTALFFLIKEVISPNANMQLENIQKIYFENISKPGDQSYDNLTFSNVKENYVFYIRELDLKRNLASDIQIHYLSEAGSIEKLLRAASAKWADGEWWLLRGTIVRYNSDGEISDHIESFNKHLSSIQESPLDLIREEQASLQMNYFQMKNNLTHKYGDRIPPSQKVELYNKLSEPWACFILVLIVAPIGLKMSRSDVFIALGKAVLLTFLYYAAQFFSMTMGKQGNLSPFIASWLANGTFGMIGLVSIRRMR